MQYAIIKSGGKQYKVNVGDTLTVDRISGDNKKIVFEDVLLLVNEGKVTLGKPSVKGAVVEGSLVENKRGEKIRVARFKAKSRYRKVTGFRSELSVIKIDKIAFGSDKKSEDTDKTAKTAPKSSEK
jgi:large subunit ribosomal protein L21